MRAGDPCALRWENVDLDGCRMKGNTQVGLMDDGLAMQLLVR